MTKIINIELLSAIFTLKNSKGGSYQRKYQVIVCFICAGLFFYCAQFTAEQAFTHQCEWHCHNTLPSGKSQQ